MEDQNNKPPTSQSNSTSLLQTILGNAMATSIKYNEERSGTETRKCSTCGAARPDGTDLSICAYCGFEFFTKDGV